MTNEEKTEYYYNVLKFLVNIDKASTNQLRLRNDGFLKFLPKFLYKFRSFKGEAFLDDYLGKNQIFFSPISSQDDRFEGITSATVNKLRKMTATNVVKKYSHDIFITLRNAFPNIDEGDIESLSTMFDDDNFDHERIKKYFDLHFPNEPKEKIDTAINAVSKSIAQVKKDILDNSRFEQAIKDIIDANKNTGIYCMAENYADQTMWSKYADDFKGYCIEYDFSDPLSSRKSIKMIGQMFPVIYKKNKDDDWYKALILSHFSAITPFGIKKEIGRFNFIEKTIEMMCTKDPSWESQMEWRIISAPNTKINGPKISSVIVGDRISKQDYLKVKEYSIKNNFPIKITDLDYETKTIFIRPLTYEDEEKITNRI